jgi:hypothetical protein
VKITITVDEDDLDRLKKRAARVAGGNISVAIMDALRMAREIEGHAELSAWLVDGGARPSRRSA